MALILCPECGKEISDKASACPHCGHPIVAATGKKSYRTLGGCAIFLILIFGLFIMGLISATVRSNIESAQPTCISDWRGCSDNADLIKRYNGIGDARFSCKKAAENSAKYGSPQWPFLSFGTFYDGDRYVKTGLAVLLEEKAQFSNGFGAMVHSAVTCTYDLNQKKVINVSITPN
jgi:DNA-directed RNA polymerase subunit RPC12/RpoP